MIRRGIDTKLNVKPVFLGLEHQYYYEGPCRFASGEALQPGYEEIFNQEAKNEFFETVKNNMPDEVHLLEPVFFTCCDDWVIPEEMFDKITSDAEEIDLFFLSGGIARSNIVIELAQRTHKPIMQEPHTISDLTAVTAVIRALGLECYAPYTWEGVARQLRVLRVRKALKQANVLLGVRFDSNASKSANDTFISLQRATEVFGTRFRFLNIHELLDYMEPISETGNYTTPGRMNTPNITAEEIQEAERLADELIAGAGEVHIDREHVVTSCKAYVEVKKLLDIHDCCGFTVPCPDTCSTRRMNQMKFTFCLTHSLLNEQGIPSACEYDVDAVLSMLVLSTISNHAPFMGNTNLLLCENGEISPMVRFPVGKLEGVEDLSNLYHMAHSVPNRKLKGIDGETGAYNLRHFAHDQKFGAVMRYDFRQDAGQPLTIFRISPDCTKIFVGKGTIVTGGDYDLNNCNGYVVYRVADQEKFYNAQLYFGNHLPFVYGDYTKELEMLGECLGLEVMSV